MRSWRTWANGSWVDKPATELEWVEMLFAQFMDPAMTRIMTEEMADEISDVSSGVRKIGSDVAAFADFPDDLGSVDPSVASAMMRRFSASPCNDIAKALMSPAAIVAAENWYSDALASDRGLALRNTAMGDTLLQIPMLRTKLETLFDGGIVDVQSHDLAYWECAQGVSLEDFDLVSMREVAKSCSEQMLFNQLGVLDVTLKVTRALSVAAAFVISNEMWESRRIKVVRGGCPL